MDKRKALSLIIVLACVFTTQAQNKKDLYLDINAPHHERILDLLSKLTIEEKYHCYVPLHLVFHGSKLISIIMETRLYMELYVLENSLYFPKLSDWQLCGTLNCCTKFQLQSRTRHAPDGMS